MQKFITLFMCYTIAYQAKANYYEEFAKQYKQDHPDIVYPQRKYLTSQEIIDGWQTASNHFKPGYRKMAYFWIGCLKTVRMTNFETRSSVRKLRRQFNLKPQILPNLSGLRKFIPRVFFLILEALQITKH